MPWFSARLQYHKEIQLILDFMSYTFQNPSSVNSTGQNSNSILNELYARYSMTYFIKDLDDKSCPVHQKSGSELMDTLMNYIDPLFLSQVLLVEAIQQSQCKMCSVSMGASGNFMQRRKIVHEVKTGSFLFVISSYDQIHIVWILPQELSQLWSKEVTWKKQRQQTLWN